MIRHFEQNRTGRDFAVGDIHGCFTKLAAALATLGFNESVDRLFSVGDLVDRGPESHLAVEWIEKPWFHAVQGNHEDLAIRYVEPGNRNAEHYMMNGGAWLIGMQRYEQVAIADALQTLPYAIEVETADGIVGIIHADVSGGSWIGTMQALRDAKSKNQLKAVTNDCLWCRDRIQAEDVSGVPDVHAVIVGHTPLKRPAILGNVYHIDTGGWLRDGYFTFVDLSTLGTIPHTTEKLQWGAE
jgi:serine/threonine protein phosphatase 1